MPNRLSHEKSPYLLQHVDNPVDWYPWGEEAFEKARKEDKPVFLSIGYSTCHWCHVMAHESFEDEGVAKLLNDNFISIKIDREERPDIDQVYMATCQALTGRGGWPLSIFMTPDGKPFFAGTYFPRSGRMGMPGFTDILKRISQAWKSEKEKILDAGEQITQAIERTSRVEGTGSMLGRETLRQACGQLQQSFDRTWGGFGDAPKFPSPHNLTFLLRWYGRTGELHARRMVETTLHAMRRGGIFDQIGFGFHRYSVDEKWLVPHFEKMLYDQAMMAMAYVEVFQATGEERFGRVAREIFTYVLRDMTDAGGGFFSAEDADSEGKEGRFYVWRPSEIMQHLGQEPGNLFCRFYDITEAGNFEDGFSIPHISVTAETFAQKEGMDAAELEDILSSARNRLFEVRKQRGKPLKDDKILTSWNGLMIAALAKGAMALGEPEYLRAAQKACDFVLENLKRGDGRLLRRYRQGEAAHLGYLEDYAFLVWGLLELFEASQDVARLEEAVVLTDVMREHFLDESAGGFYFTGKESEKLISRSKEVYDGAVPSGNSVATLNLLRLGRMTGNKALEEIVEWTIRVFSAQVSAVPMAYTQFLHAVDFIVGPTREIVVAGDPSDQTTRAMLSLIQRKFLPNKVLLFRDGGEEDDRLCSLCPFVADIRIVENQPAVHVCENYACRMPITGVGELREALE